MHTTSSSQKYEIVPLKELNTFEENKLDKVDTIYQLPFNMATVTLFQDGTSTIHPVEGEHGIIFFDRQIMGQMIKEKKFPITSGNNFWEVHKSKIVHIDKNVDYYKKLSEDYIGIPLKYDISSEYLDELSKKINEVLKYKSDEQKNYFLSIYLSELLRLSKNGQWALFPRYTIEVYFIPEIIVNNEYASAIYDFVSELSLAAIIDIDIKKLFQEIEFVPYSASRYPVLGGDIPDNSSKF